MSQQPHLMCCYSALQVGWHIGLSFKYLNKHFTLAMTTVMVGVGTNYGRVFI